MKFSVLSLVLALFFSLNSTAQNEHIVEISTDMGSMRFKLYNDTPKHRDAFLELARDGYYENTLFYRVIENFMIQGGSKTTRNAPPGKKLGIGDPDHQVDDEILPNHIHKRGALCAPRQPDEKNPAKQSDISQFYIVQGEIYTEGLLDTLELVNNQPIKREATALIYTEEIKEELARLREEKKVDEFRKIANKVKSDIDMSMRTNDDYLEFTDIQREAYTTVGGYPNLDGDYTVFGECISGFDVIDKIAALPTDKNDRPLTDLKISVKVIQ